MNRIYDERIAESGKLEASHFEAKLKNVDRLFDAGQQYRAPKDAAVHVSFLEVSLSYIFYCLCKNSVQILQTVLSGRAQWSVPSQNV